MRSEQLTDRQTGPDPRTTNLLGALVLGLMDQLVPGLEATCGHRGGGPAALVSLGVYPGVSIDGLRQVLQLSHPGTVRLIDRLEADGFVERRAGSDGRSVALFLTEAGIQARSRLLNERRQPLATVLAGLSQTEQQQLLPLLEKLLTRLTQTEQQSQAICRLCEEEVCPAPACPVELRYQQLVDQPSPLEE